MKKLIGFLVSGILVVSTVGCGNNTAKTSSDPNTTNETSAPAKEASQTTQTKDKTADKASKNELTTEVSKKLKQELPNSKLDVQGKDGDLTIKGTVASEAELKKVESLAKGVKGVKSAKVEAKVDAAKKQ